MKLFSPGGDGASGVPAPPVSGSGGRHERETTERELADSSSPGMKTGRETPRAKTPEPGRGKRIEMDLGL